MKWVFLVLGIALVSGCVQNPGIVIESPGDVYAEGDEIHFSLKNNYNFPVDIPSCRWMYIEKYTDGWNSFYSPLCGDSSQLFPGEERVFVFRTKNDPGWTGNFRAVSNVGFLCDRECVGGEDAYFEFRIEERKCTTSDDCEKGGCAGEICGFKGFVEKGDCSLPEEFGCLEKTECICVNGECVWDETPEFIKCKESLQEGCGCGK